MQEPSDILAHTTASAATSALEDGTMLYGMHEVTLNSDTNGSDFSDVILTGTVIQRTEDLRSVDALNALHEVFDTVTMMAVVLLITIISIAVSFFQVESQTSAKEFEYFFAFLFLTEVRARHAARMRMNVLEGVPAHPPCRVSPPRVRIAPYARARARAPNVCSICAACASHGVPPSC